MVELREIILITCEGYLTTLLMEGGLSVKISKLLKEFEIELENYGFIRVNHNSIVNAYHIISIDRGKNRLIILSNNMKVRISRRKLYKLNAGNLTNNGLSKVLD